MSLRKLSESQWNLLMAHYGEPETRERWGGTVPNSFEAASANAARAASNEFGCFAVDDAAGGWRARRLTVTGMGRDTARDAIRMAEAGEPLPKAIRRALAAHEPGLVLADPDPKIRLDALKHMGMLTDGRLDSFLDDPDPTVRLELVDHTPDDRLHVFGKETDSGVLTKLEYRATGWIADRAVRLFETGSPDAAWLVLRYGRPDAALLRRIVESGLADRACWSLYAPDAAARDGSDRPTLTEKDIRLLLEHGDPDMVGSYLSGWMPDDDPRRERLTETLYDHWAEHGSAGLLERLSLSVERQMFTPRRVDMILERGSGAATLARLGDGLSSAQVDMLLAYADAHAMDVPYRCRRHGGYTPRQLRLLAAGSLAAGSPDARRAMREAAGLLARLCSDPTDPDGLGAILATLG